ncbi:MAG: hypothetical protein SOY39_09210 [Lachnospiraceae bacterium]|nr:hypothetical protein [Lachnospiraceae bacterium]
MFCGECGAELRSDAVKCPVCGTNVSEHFVPQEGEEERTVEHQQEMDTGVNAVHNVYSEEVVEPVAHIQMASGENQAASSQNINQEEQSGQIPGKSPNNMNWIWITVVLMLLGLVIGAIMMQISGKQEDNASDENYDDVYAESENEEQYDDEISEDDAYEFSEEDDWIAGESDVDLEEEIPELRAALELSYDEIDPATLPTGETWMMLIGEYIYVSKPGQEAITVLNQSMEKVAEILPNIGLINTDGKYIYYNDGLSIFRADPDGTHVTEIVNSGEDWEEGFIGFVPINGFIYYSYWDNENAHLYKMDMDNGNVEELYTSEYLIPFRHEGHVDMSDENNQLYHADTGEMEEREEPADGWNWPVFPVCNDENEFEYLTDHEGNQLYVFEDDECSVFYDLIGDYFYCVSQISGFENEDYRYYLYKISTGEMVHIF